MVYDTMCGDDAWKFTEIRDFVLYMHYVGKKIDIVPRTENKIPGPGLPKSKVKLGVPVLLNLQPWAAVSERQ